MSQKKIVKVFISSLLIASSLVSLSSVNVQADLFATSIAVGSDPQGVAISPNGVHAYVTNNGSFANTVSKINVATDTVAATIAVGTQPWGIAINPVGTFAYVANKGNDTVSKIDLATDTVVTTIAVGTQPWDIAISPAGSFAYVTNQGSGTVTKIDLTTDAVVTAIAVGLDPTGIAISPAGSFAYVANERSGTISKIDLATDTVVTTIAVGTQPWDIAISPAGSFAYVANFSSSSTVSKIDLRTNAVVGTIAVGACPNNIAISPAGSFAYVTNQCGEGSVSKINLATDTVTTVPVGVSYKNPRGVAINPAGTLAYVALHSTPGTVAKITLSATEQQSITFGRVSTQLLGAGTVALSAGASSTLAVSFSSVTPTVCTVAGSAVTFVAVGDCTIDANQYGGSGWDAAQKVSQTFSILPSPPSGEVGVSIKSGDTYTNKKEVPLDLIWPEYATAVRISNDGGFAASKTKSVSLTASVNWVLDDSLKGLFTKVVYVRFTGSGIDNTKTYSDDIILDTTAPTINSSSAIATTSSIDVKVDATDDITGVETIEIDNGQKIISKDYSKTVKVSLGEAGMAVSGASVSKSSVKTLRVRVRDAAVNWTEWKNLTLTGKSVVVVQNQQNSKSLTLSTRRSVSGKSIAQFAKIEVPSGSKMAIKISASSKKTCRVTGTSVKGLKSGTCKITVSVKTKSGKTKTKTVSLKVSK
jgi:YVTN family beta-propeller protein